MPPSSSRGAPGRPISSAGDSGHVKIKPAVAATIDAFHARHMQGRDTIGVHVRRTDHVGRESLPVDAEAFFQAIDSQPADCRIFVATDCHDTLQRFLARYG